MKLTSLILRSKPTFFSRGGILLVIISAAAVLSASAGGKNDGAEKICDAKIRYCVEQNCMVPFDQVRSGILSAYAFFERLGYPGRYPVQIEFRPQVFITWGKGEAQTKIRVLGKYEEKEKKI